MDEPANQIDSSVRSGYSKEEAQRSLQNALRLNFEKNCGKCGRQKDEIFEFYKFRCQAENKSLKKYLNGRTFYDSYVEVDLGPSKGKKRVPYVKPPEKKKGL